MGRIVDLTMRLKPGLRGVEFEQAREIWVNGWNARVLHLYSHAGTHVDAPAHFIDGGATLDDLPLERCIGPAVVAHLTGLAPRERIMTEHLGAVADSVGQGSRLLLHTGWSERLGAENYRTHSPRVDLSLAQWLAERGVWLLGIDCPSVADVGNLEELRAVHQTLLGAGIVIVEDLVNLGEFRSKTVELIVLPLRVAGGDGAPARAIAIEDAAGE